MKEIMNKPSTFSPVREKKWFWTFLYCFILFSLVYLVFYLTIKILEGSAYFFGVTFLDNVLLFFGFAFFASLTSGLITLTIHKNLISPLIFIILISISSFFLYSPWENIFTFIYYQLFLLGIGIIFMVICKLARGIYRVQNKKLYWLLLTLPYTLSLIIFLGIIIFINIF